MRQRKSPRAQRYDYTSSGGYFITICTKDRVHYFGEMENKEIVLSELGKICMKEIENISNRTTIDIHEYIVMPNHIHLLLVMSNFTEDMNIGYNRRDALQIDEYTNGRDAFAMRPNIETRINDHNIRHATSMSLQMNQGIQIMHENYKGPKLGQIIGVLKGNITKYAKEHDIVFTWQGRYHDHIIRNEDEYHKIKHYIQTNPENRESDSLA